MHKYSTTFRNRNYQINTSTRHSRNLSNTHQMRYQHTVCSLNTMVIYRLQVDLSGVGRAVSEGLGDDWQADVGVIGRTGPCVARDV